MSDDNIQPAEQAGEVLFDSVYVPAFLKRCSDVGIAFADDNELITALQNVLMLKVAEANVNQQSSDEDMHKAANLMLRHALGEDVEKTAYENESANCVADALNATVINDDVRQAAALLAGNVPADN